MNEQSSFERLVADQLAHADLGAPPEFAINETIARAGGTRRLPRWLALIKETPMRTSSSLAVGSPIARAAAVMVATLLLAIVVVGGSIAGSRVLASDGLIVVDQDGSGDATTITDAVAMAANGDEILVRPGTYAEAIRVDKDITVRGDGDREAVIIVFPPDSPALTFTDGAEGDPDDPLIEYSVPVGVWMAAPSAELSGVTVSGPQPGIGVTVTDGVAQLADLVITLDGLDAEETDDPALDTRLAVAVVGSANASLRDSRLDAGVDVTDDASATVEDSFLIAGEIWNGGTGELAVRRNTITNAGIRSGGSAGTIEDNDLTGGFISLDGDGHATVSGNTIDALRYDFGPGVAISLWDDVTADISGNTITNSATGIKTLFYRGSATIEGNTLTSNVIGISVGGYDTVVADNTITGSAAIGIEVFGAGPTLTGNQILSNAAGLHLGDPRDTTITGNTVCDNGTNIRLVTGEMPDLSDNEICEDAPSE